MDITLVTSSFDKVVHGTENEKKTGCGINLMKPENVTRFHRTSRMTDLKEITCEKCKASLAKKLIKADKKEMALLLKEEKKREKMGMNDAGIVPLGNTTARITDPAIKIYFNLLIRSITDVCAKIKYPMKKANAYIPKRYTVITGVFKICPDSHRGIPSSRITMMCIFSVNA